MLYKAYCISAMAAKISKDSLFVSTGVKRAPKKGEWFLDILGAGDEASIASFDFPEGVSLLILRPYIQKHNRDSKGRFIKGDGAEKPFPAPRPEPAKRSWWQKLRGK